ncbi:SLH domain protein [Peptoniphilus sp. BV3AC2]|nr:SLH domain protein [Peptoniphilus sp. BV3AC2]
MLVISMMLSSLVGSWDVMAATIPEPTVNPVLIGDTTISGGNVYKTKVQVGKKKQIVIATVHVTLKAKDGTVKATFSEASISSKNWSVSLPSGAKPEDNIEVAEGDTVTVYQQLGEDKSPEVNVTAQPSKASSVTLTMPSGEIWIEKTNANLVNQDENAEAVQLLKDVNSTIVNDIKSIKFTIDGINHAYYEVTYTDGSTSGKVEATDLKIKQVTETSAAPTIEKVQVTDGQIIVTLAKEVATGTKFYFIKNFTDGEDKKFCQNGNCKADKSNPKEISQAISIDGKKVTFPVKDDDLKLGREFGIIVKEPHKFRSCAMKEPVVTTPAAKVAVRDPHKLTDDDKKAIDKAIRDANTVNGVSKLPDGTGFITDPAFIEFDKDGNVTIISPNDVESNDWDSNGNPIYEKNTDGTYKVKAESKVYEIPAKDLLKNLKPDAPTVALSGDKKNITITPNEKDTDASSISVSYTGKDGSPKTTTATKADDGTWSITEGEGSVDKNGVVTLPKDKVKGDTTVTATVTDKGGVADDDKTPLTSEPGTLTVKETKADKVEALGGLDPVVLKKWVKDTVDWKDGVKAKDSATEENKGKINELLKEAKFEDVTEEKRSTSNEGDFEGKIKITFDDKSELVVEKQILYVSNHVTSVERKDKVPADAVDVEFKLGEGTRVDNTDGTAIEGNKDNPVSYQKYMVKPQTNLKEYKHQTLNETYYNLINSKVKAIDKYTEPVWNGENGSVTENFIITDSNKVFTAKATKTYDITFDANTGGGTKDKVTQKVNTEYVLPAANTFTAPENKQFSGWQVGEDTTLKQPGAKIKITGDTVVKAIWKPIEFKVKFQTEAGASGTMEDKTVNKGSKYELPKPTFTPEKGKEFAGWKIEGQDGVKKVGDKIDITGDVTLTATWKDIEYKVTFNGTEGKGSMPEKLVKKGEKYTLPENGFEAPKDKVFDGWMVGTEKKSAGETITVNGDTEVKAVWTDKPAKVEFNVTFDGNGGTGSMVQKTVEKDKKYILPSNGFTAPEGKEFDGWMISNEKKSVGDEITVTDNITVVAQWKDKTTTPNPPQNVKNPSISVDLNGNLVINPPTEGEVTSVTVNYQDPSGNQKTATAAKSSDVWNSTKAENGETVNKTSGVITIPRGNYKLGEPVTAVANNKQAESGQATETPVEVKLEKNDGSNNESNSIVIKNQFYVLPAIYELPEYMYTAPEGKEFDGWEVGGVKQAPGTRIQITKNTVLKAIWKEKGQDSNPQPNQPVPQVDSYNPWWPIWFGSSEVKPATPAEPKVEYERGLHRKYLYGYKDHTVRPEGLITRAEAAALIARLAELDMSNNMKPNFKDTKSAWYNTAINAVVAKNLMFADKDGDFRPNEPITRGEFARALFFIDKKNDKVAPFADVKGHVYEEAINQAYGNDRIKGYPDGTFKPDATITRAEAATILNNYADRNVTFKGMVEVHKDVVKFTDINESHWAYYEIMEAANTHEYQREKGTIPETWLEILKK